MAQDRAASNTPNIGTAGTPRRGGLGAALPFFRFIFLQRDLLVVIFILAVLAIIIVPLPSALLDLFLTISIALSVLIILTGFYIEKPTDFSTFPTLLLMVTLFRLALNVATTRMILSNGHLGVDAVSDIISSFGNFVVGGDYVIGIIVFAILVIVNFLVITNGASRVSEVQARFTLDAMPGKQMAIDADLNSGLIDGKEAERRRAALHQERDFYGAMDGASKFVKNDAIAGIIITFVNIIGGFLIGVFGHGMSVSQSAGVFTILTIGDGLVSQIPALIISTATGIVITRTTSSDGSGFAEDIVKQLMGNSKVLAIVGAMLAFFALIPGLPTLSLGFVGALFLLISYLGGTQRGSNAWANLTRKFAPKTQAQTPKIRQVKEPQQRDARSRLEEQEKRRKQEQEILDSKLKFSVLRLSLGMGLAKIANPEDPNAPIFERIRGIRESYAQSHGFIIPMVQIQANPFSDFAQNGYEIFLKDIVVGQGKVYADKFLALNTGVDAPELDGERAKDPVMGLDGFWIDKKDKDDASIAGYTVVDASHIISVHILEIVKANAANIITRQDTKNLIERLRGDDKDEKDGRKEGFPSLVEDALKLPLGVTHQVLKDLLGDGIPIRDMLTILETIVDVAPRAQNNPQIIITHVRKALARTISDLVKSDDGKLKIFTLSAQSDNALQGRIIDSQDGKVLSLNQAEITMISNALTKMLEKTNALFISPLIVTSTALRAPFANLIARLIESKNSQSIVRVIADAEIARGAQLEFLGDLEINLI